MPEISRFFGIVIAIYYKDHGPAHFHASYAGDKVTVNIEDGSVDGKFATRALSMVQEWRELHKVELRENWELARRREPLKRIAPLD